MKHNFKLKNLFKITCIVSLVYFFSFKKNVSSEIFKDLDTHNLFLNPSSSLQYCKSQISKVYKKPNKKSISNFCKQVEILEDCYSQQKRPLFHYEKSTFIKKGGKKGKKILTLSLIHGDEEPSIRLAHSWINRLNSINPRNTWRVIPIVNPDGWLLKTRTNANGVDLNRNFPTANWRHLALKKWKIDRKADPRRYPGPFPASEPETQCIMSHLEDFKPDFIISIHSPYGVLDFDGPKKIKFPYFKPLPWISLGHFPGSLGRYMWKDHSVPVLTIELKEKEGFKKLEAFDRLQDISGTVAIQADQVVKKKRIKSEIKSI